MEKLEKKNSAFLSAFLGSRSNKEQFLKSQSGHYPDIGTWAISAEENEQLRNEIKERSTQLERMFDLQNRIAEIEQELLQLQPEAYHFSEYYDACAKNFDGKLKGLTSDKLLQLWLEFERYYKSNSKLSFLRKLSIVFKFNFKAYNLFTANPHVVIPYLQHQFYIVKAEELQAEKAALKDKLKGYSFDYAMQELTDCSLRLFKSFLSMKYRAKTERQIFDSLALYKKHAEFANEYPVILSTTYSVKSALNPDHIYDYIIVDEASQVDLATAVLAFSCAKNIVIVGDLQQLPNVITEHDIQICKAIEKEYSLPEFYCYTNHSLLSAALNIWPTAPTTLLREHYRCHPKIIGFCNQKFYNNQLIVMTKDQNEADVLTMYRTACGNHARGHLNQRQIDIIKQEALPKIKAANYNSIGIITPYNEQAKAITSQLEDSTIEVATVHKFQGREKDAIILTSVDNVISDFVDEPRMLNVAVSRAVKSLSVIVSQDVRNDKTNYGELARYIAYNNCEIIESAVYSVFDLLYQNYAVQREIFLKKHGRVSEYDSENLIHAIVEDLLRQNEFASIGCAVHVSLSEIIRDHSILETDEELYVSNPLTHVDFLLFRRLDKVPLLAVEVDGVAFHQRGSAQFERDLKKNRIFEKCKIPLLRLRTDGSGEKERMEQALRAAIK